MKNRIMNVTITSGIQTRLTEFASRAPNHYTRINRLKFSLVGKKNIKDKIKLGYSSKEVFKSGLPSVTTYGNSALLNLATGEFGGHS